MDTENNVQIGGMKTPLYNIFGYEGRVASPPKLTDTITVEEDGFTTSDIDYLALMMKDGEYEENKMKLRTRQLFSMIPWNATPVDIGLSLRGVLKEGYGGYAAGDVIFVSDERSIVIQTIYTREIVTIGKKVFKRWNSYNEVFFVCEYVRDPRIISTDGLNFMFKSINADRFKNNEFGSRFLVTKSNAQISKGSKIIFGSSVSYPVDRILKANSMSMKDIDKFWNTLKENYEANDVDYLNKLLSFKDEDTELLQTKFKIRSNISYEIERFEDGRFDLLDKDRKAISHEANNLEDLKILLKDWEITEFNKTDGMLSDVLYYKIEQGGKYGHVKYSVDGISGIMDDGTPITEINPGDKLVFLHPANGLLSTPEFGYSVIYDGDYSRDPSNIKQIDLLVKNTAGTETAVAGLIYKEWNNKTVDTDKILNQIYTRGLQLNIKGKGYDLNICPMLWDHKLSMRWGEGAAKFSAEDRGYKTVVEEDVKCAYKDKWSYIKFNREDEFVEPEIEDDYEKAVPTAGKFIIKKDLIDKSVILDEINEWKNNKFTRIKDIKGIDETKGKFEGDVSVEDLLKHVSDRIEANWKGGNTLEYNIFVDLLQFGLNISSKNTVQKIENLLSDELEMPLVLDTASELDEDMIGDEVVVEDDAEVDAKTEVEDEADAEAEDEDKVILTPEEIESINNMEREEKNEHIKNMSPEKRNAYFQTRPRELTYGTAPSFIPASNPPGNTGKPLSELPESRTPEEFEAFSTPPPPPGDNTDGPVVDKIPEDVDTPDDGLLAGVKKDEDDDTGSVTVDSEDDDAKNVAGSDEDNAERNDEDAKSDKEEEEMVVEDVDSDEAVGE